MSNITNVIKKGVETISKHTKAIKSGYEAGKEAIKAPEINALGKTILKHDHPIGGNMLLGYHACRLSKHGMKEQAENGKLKKGIGDFFVSLKPIVHHGAGIEREGPSEDQVMLKIATTALFAMCEQYNQYFIPGDNKHDVYVLEVNQICPKYLDSIDAPQPGIMEKASTFVDASSKTYMEQINRS